MQACPATTCQLWAKARSGSTRWGAYRTLRSGHHSNSGEGFQGQSQPQSTPPNTKAADRDPVRVLLALCARCHGGDSPCVVRRSATMSREGRGGSLREVGSWGQLPAAPGSALRGVGIEEELLSWVETPRRATAVASGRTTRRSRSTAKPVGLPSCCWRQRSAN